MNDPKAVQAAVKIKISLDRRTARKQNGTQKHAKLLSDLHRLIKGMSHQDYNEYLKRVQ